MKTKLELIKNYPIESLKNWGDYFGYPEAICKSMVEMADCDWQNAKIGVLDDFGFQMINFLIQVKNVPLENIYFLVSEADETKVELMKNWYSNFVENEVASIYNIDSMFDLIIANPPYGKGLYRRIIQSILKSRPAQCVALTPWDWVQGKTSASFREELKVENLEKIDNRQKQIFDISYDYLASFCFGSRVKNPLNIEDYWEEIKKDPLEEACRGYNELHPWGDRSAVNSSFESMKKKGGNIENTFLLGCWKTTKESWVKDWNINNDESVVYKPTKKGGASNGVFSARYFILKDVKEKKNAADWFYGSKLFLKGIPNSCFPHVDWSHPWTDVEILKELGLPEDFLEKDDE